MHRKKKKRRTAVYGKHDPRDMPDTVESVTTVPLRDRYQNVGRHRRRLGVYATAALAVSGWAIAGSLWAALTFDVVRGHNA
jgi:hypothetical protein